VTKRQIFKDSCLVICIEGTQELKSFILAAKPLSESIFAATHLIKEVFELEAGSLYF